MDCQLGRIRPLFLYSELSFLKGNARCVPTKSSFFLDQFSRRLPCSKTLCYSIKGLFNDRLGVHDGKESCFEL